jgi:hypothetical protein
MTSKRRKFPKNLSKKDLKFSPICERELKRTKDRVKTG